MIILKLIYTFAHLLAKHLSKLFVNNSTTDTYILKIIYPSGLHLCSTLGGFSLLKGFGYGI